MLSKSFGNVVPRGSVLPTDDAGDGVTTPDGRRPSGVALRRG